MRRTTLVALVCLGWATAASAAGEAQPMSPRQAVERAADAAGDAGPGAPVAGVSGVFDLQVRASGTQNGHVFLNSERDYRDQRDLTIDIPPPLSADLRSRYGAAPDAFFAGKHIQVRGVAHRVTIHIFDDHGQVTDKYYYQTHVMVADPDQIKLLD